MNTLKNTLIFILVFLVVGHVEARRSELIMQKAVDGRYVPAIPVYTINNVPYFSADDLLKSYKTTAFINPAVRKAVFRLDRVKFKISAYNHYVMVEDRTFQMQEPALFFDEVIFLPVTGFTDILKEVGLISGFRLLEGREPETAEKAFEEEASAFDIRSAIIEERQNGIVIRVRTSPRYDASSVKAWINRGEWLFVTLPGAIIDKPILDATEIPQGSMIKDVVADQLEGTAQLSFRIKGTVEGVDVLHRDSPPEILLTVRKPYVIDQTHFLNKERAKWKLDKIVLDAGHGGHDAGARGNGLKEKDIVLDVVKRLGRLIEKRTDIEVVYTRKTDKFVPLWERTKIANEVEGKVFLSIHVNASKNRRASGFETYLLRPGKIDKAVEVAELENSVIKLEENVDRYKDLGNEQYILATMAQSSFMQESEILADLIQLEFDKKLSGSNRGVKQAGFIVLIGASMPNVLIELGFISNRQDASLLKRSSYRQKAAESIFDALMKFKTRHEKLLSPS